MTALSHGRQGVAGRHVLPQRYAIITSGLGLILLSPPAPARIYLRKEANKMSEEFAAILKMVEGATNQAVWVAIAYMVWKLLMLITGISGAIAAVVIVLKIVGSTFVTPVCRSMLICKRIYRKIDPQGRNELYPCHYDAIDNKLNSILGEDHEPQRLQRKGKNDKRRT